MCLVFVSTISDNIITISFSGFGYSSEVDDKTISDLVKFLKGSVHSVTCFVLLFKGVDKRFSLTTVNWLKVIQNIFGGKLLDHVILGVRNFKIIWLILVSRTRFARKSLCALCCTFEKLFWGDKVWLRSQNGSCPTFSLYEIDPWSQSSNSWWIDCQRNRWLPTDCFNQLFNQI